MSVIYLWLDIETTGLDPKVDQMLEIAWVFTDQNLDPIYPADFLYVKRPGDYGLVIREPKVVEMHVRSGLLSQWACQQEWHSYREAEAEILRQICKVDFPDGWDGTIQIAGSGVHFDLRWLEVCMPELYHRLHYRIGVDVSQLKRFLGDVCGLELPFWPEPEHRAMSDVLGSLTYAQKLQGLVRPAPDVPDDEDPS